jgi:hypothetical protein
VIAAGGIGLAVTLSGCNTSSLTKRELVVYFAQNTSETQQKAALSACSNVTPQATPEPFVTGNLPADTVGDVRFRIDHADDRAVALLENCLNAQPGVRGAQDSADSMQ